MSAAGLPTGFLAFAARAAELPSAGQLRQGIGVPPHTVSVHEPHPSVGDRHVTVDYVGYPAADVFEWTSVGWNGGASSNMRVRGCQAAR